MLYEDYCEHTNKNQNEVSQNMGGCLFFGAIIGSDYYQ